MNPMKKNPRNRGVRYALLPLAMLIAGEAAAAEYWLCVGKFNKVMPPTATYPTGEVVPMWGYALETDKDFSNGCNSTPKVPGPVLNVPVGDNTLTVHLHNNLVGLPYSEAVSIVIPGLVATMAPEFVTDAQNRERVNSLTNSVDPGTSGIYTWNSVKAGTYLYHSGTHPQVQVPMGLYGAVTQRFGYKLIYEGVGYDVVATRIFSEVDPVYNKAIYNGRFGVPSPNGQPNPRYPSSAIGYQPRYFLINGQAYPKTVPINMLVGQRMALRLLNASLNTRVPVLQGTPYLSVVGEDGNKLANPQQKYNVFLPALKTMDAIVTPTAPGKFPLYDRRLGLTNHTALGGGMLTYLNVTTP